MTETTVPQWCSCTADEYTSARALLAAKSASPGWSMLASFRRSALAAQMSSGVFIEPMLACEFDDVLRAAEYRPRAAAPNATEHARVVATPPKCPPDRTNSYAKSRDARDMLAGVTVPRPRQPPGGWH